jgi:predicted AlkP superfamily pyrophosphatase or phosphodiesterase
MSSCLRRFSVLFFLLIPAFATLAHSAPVLMISIDGLKPEYITQADTRGMKLPYLRTMLRDGSYADGVIGVWPTVTYPSHTTLLTGVSPAVHGINNNLQFDPQMHYGSAWNWYASQIQSPTLWKAAHSAGLSTASIGWPVSVGATDVDWLIPEFWRTADPSAAVNPADRLLLDALSRPATLIQQLAPAAGPYMMGNDTTVAGDETKTRYALEVLRRYRPAFMTIHLSSLDEAQHEHAPFSTEAKQTLESIDGMVARLAAAAIANDPSAIVVVVSDHGFMDISHFVNLAIPFVQAGLVQASANPQSSLPTIASWKAEPWLAGGMAAVMLKDTGDRQTEQQVRTLLDKLAADPNNGIAEILDRDAIARRETFPSAAFLVVLKPGYYTGQAISGNLVTEIPGSRGSHGFSPEYPEMRSSFFAVGAGIARHRDLGVVHMQQIAPTVAGILGVSMPSAKAAPLNVKP